MSKISEGFLETFQPDGMKRYPKGDRVMSLKWKESYKKAGIFHTENTTTLQHSVTQGFGKVAKQKQFHAAAVDGDGDRLVTSWAHPLACPQTHCPYP